MEKSVTPNFRNPCLQLSNQCGVPGKNTFASLRQIPNTGNETPINSNGVAIIVPQLRIRFPRLGLGSTGALGEGLSSTATGAAGGFGVRAPILSNSFRWRRVKGWSGEGGVFTTLYPPHDNS